MHRYDHPIRPIDRLPSLCGYTPIGPIHTYIHTCLYAQVGYKLRPRELWSTFRSITNSTFTFQTSSVGRIRIWPIWISLPIRPCNPLPGAYPASGRWSAVPGCGGIVRPRPWRREDHVTSLVRIDMTYNM